LLRNATQAHGILSGYWNDLGNGRVIRDMKHGMLGASTAGS